MGPQAIQADPVAVGSEIATRPPRCWAVVLAGGEGLHLRSLVRQALGANRPTQYVKLLGPRTLLGETLNRISLAFPLERTLVSTLSRHAGYIAEEFAGAPRPTILAQPIDRGTAAGVLYPAHWIAWRDPEATVAVFPSDHFLLGGTNFMAHVAEVVAWVGQHPNRLVLLGAQPTAPEAEYSYVEPGERLGDLSTSPIREVRQFWERPSVARARSCLRAGHLWNTSIVVGKVATLIRIGGQALPSLSERLARIEPFAGTDHESDAVRQAYELLPEARFSRSVLEACRDTLSVSRLPRIVWSNLSSTHRVMEALTRMRIRPEWAAASPPLD